MNNRETFRNIFSYQSIEQMPAYFFGTWVETKKRWRNEGFSGELDMVQAGGNVGPQLEGMGPDWENHLWDAHGLVNVYPIGDKPCKILFENEREIITSDSIGMVKRALKNCNCIDHTIEFALKPTRDSWQHFKKYLNPHTPNRYCDNLTQRCEQLNEQNKILGSIGGSLYGYLRDWMGVEELSYLMYDDPELLSEMVGYIADFFITLYQPILPLITFDFMYIFEDCCGATGPLFSPDTFEQIFKKHYQRLIKFYKSNNVCFILLDSDGYVEPLIESWLSAGVDILFPIEVGTWCASPTLLREKYGKRLKMMGGVDKRLIATGGNALREHLQSLKNVTLEGGFLPIPDHRIAPDCSLEKFIDYIRMFHEVFNS